MRDMRPDSIYTIGYCSSHLLTVLLASFIVLGVSAPQVALRVQRMDGRAGRQRFGVDLAAGARQRGPASGFSFEAADRPLWKRRALSAKHFAGSRLATVRHRDDKSRIHLARSYAAAGLRRAQDQPDPRRREVGGAAGRPYAVADGHPKASERPINDSGFVLMPKATWVAPTPDVDCP